MVALYIIAGIVIFFAALLSLNVSFRVIYKSDSNIDIYAKIGFYKIYIIPGNLKKQEKLSKRKEKKESKPDKIRKKKPKKIKEKDVKDTKEKKKLNISKIIELVKNILSVLWKKLSKYLKIKIYRINASTASKDACKTAMLYGTVIQSAHYIYDFLNSNFKISGKKKDEIIITADFAREKMSFDIDVKIYIRLSHILNIALSCAIIYLKFRAESKAADVSVPSDLADLADLSDKK